MTELIKAEDLEFSFPRVVDKCQQCEGTGIWQQNFCTYRCGCHGMVVREMTSVEKCVYLMRRVEQIIKSKEQT